MSFSFDRVTPTPHRSSSAGRVVGILLAAGASRRFGADKLKQSLAGGDWVAVRACRKLLAGTDQVLAVVRPGTEELAERLRAEGADVFICAEADQGMGASLASGVRATCDAAGWLIALADMPWVKIETIVGVANAIRHGAVLAAPRFQGQRGHPVGFASVYRAELAALGGDGGAKVVIAANSDKLRLIDCDDRGILQDIDEPTDWALRR